MFVSMIRASAQAWFLKKIATGMVVLLPKVIAFSCSTVLFDPKALSCFPNEIIVWSDLFNNLNSDVRQCMSCRCEVCSWWLWSYSLVNIATEYIFLFTFFQAIVGLRFVQGDDWDTILVSSQHPSGGRVELWELRESSLTTHKMFLSVQSPEGPQPSP